MLFPLIPIFRNAGRTRFSICKATTADARTPTSRPSWTSCRIWIHRPRHLPSCKRTSCVWRRCRTISVVFGKSCATFLILATMLTVSSLSRHTGTLEVFHSTSLAYTAKRHDYDYDVMKMRKQLAVLDHNHHLLRELKWDAEKNEPVKYNRSSKKSHCYVPVFVKVSIFLALISFFYLPGPSFRKPKRTNTSGILWLPFWTGE